MEKELPQIDASLTARQSDPSLRKRIKYFLGLSNQNIEELPEHLTGLKINPSAPHADNN